MAHPAQMNFFANVAHHLDAYFTRKKVLEVGSLDINGSVRQFFTDCDYLGIDVAEGKSVDRVCRGEDFDAPGNYFDTVVSANMFEHNREWRKTWLNMLRVLRPDGLLVFSVASGGTRQHGTSEYGPEFSPLTHAQGDDYYRNLLEKDFLSIVLPDAIFSEWEFFENRASHDLFFIGLAHHAAPEHQQTARALRNAFREYYEKVNILGQY